MLVFISVLSFFRPKSIFSISLSSLVHSACFLGGNGTLGRGKKGIERRREGGRCTGGSNNSWKLKGKGKGENKRSRISRRIQRWKGHGGGTVGCI